MNNSNRYLLTNLLQKLVRRVMSLNVSKEELALTVDRMAELFDAFVDRKKKENKCEGKH